MVPAAAILRAPCRPSRHCRSGAVRKSREPGAVLNGTARGGRMRAKQLT